jgi:hypothetical protein
MLSWKSSNKGAVKINFDLKNKVCIVTSQTLMNDGGATAI